MSWSKRMIINEMFGELAMQGYEFDITPDEQATALRRLDTMLATWEAKGIRIGYAFPASAGDSDLDDDSGLPDSAVEPVYLNLAIRQAPGYGKQVSPETRRAAREGYDTLLWAAAQPIEQQLPSTLPRGAGNKPWRSANLPYFPLPNDGSLQINSGGDLEILPE